MIGRLATWAWKNSNRSYADFLKDLFPAGRTARQMENFYNGVTNPGLRAAIKQGASQIPFLGGLIKAGDAYNQTMDLYNNTGRTSAYPSIVGNAMPNLNQYLPQPSNEYVPKRDFGKSELQDFYMYM